MTYKYQYTIDEEKTNLLKEHSDKILIEEQNITEGNFLIFSDTKPVNEQLEDITNTVNQIQLKQEEII